MRAHFAGDVEDGGAVAAAASPGDSDAGIEKGGDEAEADAFAAAAEDGGAVSLETRIEDFKRDSQNMEDLTEFIDEVLHSAESEALKQQKAKATIKSQQTKEKSRQSFSIPDFKNGKVVNRARGLVVRIFDAIGKACVGAAAPAQRIKLRGKRSSTPAAQNGCAETEVGEGKEKSTKKADTGKEKKDDKKKEKEKDKQPAEEGIDDIQLDSMQVQSA